jgi:radical SAM protein with 4Fe4S-binding SPASM domain
MKNIKTKHLNTIDTEHIFQTAKDICLEPLNEGKFAVWNKYAPAVMFINQDCLKLLEYMKENQHPYKEFKGVKSVLRKLIHHHIICKKENNNYHQQFLNSGLNHLQTIEESMKNQTDKKLPYVELTFVNKACNLNCSYCILKYIKDSTPLPVKQSSSKKLEKVIRIIDQFLERSAENTMRRRIHFNGGEILLEFNIIENVFNHVRKNYPNEKIEFTINTNATLINEDIARFLVKKKFNNVTISIDGYKQNSDQTRVYHDGTSAFEDIIKGMSYLNQFRKKPIDFFQGTISANHSFDPNRVQEMKQFGFKRARLGVDLLGITPNEAKKMAKLHFNMVIESLNKDILVKDDYLETFKSAVEDKPINSHFHFYCSGLTSLAGKMICYNIDTDHLNLLCSFATGVQVSFSDAKNNIYHESLFEKGIDFLKARFQTFTDNCLDCSLASICKGGCFMTGIDPANVINKGACAFQNEAWKQFLRHTGTKKNKVKTL